MFVTGRISISGNRKSLLDTLHRKSRLNSLAAEENRYPLLSDIGVADGSTPLTTVQASSVFVTPLARTGVADGNMLLTTVQAGSVFVTPLARTGVADGSTPLTTVQAGSAGDGVRSFADFHACAASAMVKMYISLVLSVE